MSDTAVFRSRVDLRVSFDDGIYANSVDEAREKMIQAWIAHIEEEYPDHIFMNLETSVTTDDPVLVTEENDLWRDEFTLPFPD